MGFVSLTVQQMIVMLLYMVLGYLLFQMGALSSAGSKEIAALLVKLVVPAVLINSFCTTFSKEILIDLLKVFLLALLALLCSMIIAALIFHRYPIENFSAAFSNAGFMGIPMVNAVLGSSAVIYAVPFVALLNLLQWTYGVDTICETRSKISFRKILWNPPMVGIGIGMVLFLTGLGTEIPMPLRTILADISSLNTPLAMIVLGVYLAKEEPKTLFSCARIYCVSVVRLLVIPLCTLLLVWLIPIQRQASLAVMICAAAPVGVNVAVYAQLHGRDYAYASKIVVVSTLLSVITLPAITILSQKVL